MKRELKYIPTAIQMYFKEIDFVKLYEQGKRIILTMKGLSSSGILSIVISLTNSTESPFLM